LKVLPKVTRLFENFAGQNKFSSFDGFSVFDLLERLVSPSPIEAKSPPSRNQRSKICRRLKIPDQTSDYVNSSN